MAGAAAHCTPSPCTPSPDFRGLGQRASPGDRPEGENALAAPVAQPPCLPSLEPHRLHRLFWVFPNNELLS